ncbi:Ig-like domain-containing protein, partial [Morganella morganii]|uniref:Ig-like domain-containing protein n=1 Tax=Morganella morganii TaxID=582 RepID=UPI003EBA578A
AKTESLWTDNSDGTYSRTYIAKTAGTGLKVRVQLAGWESAAESAAYSISADTSSAALKAADLTVLVNNKASDGVESNEVQAFVKDKFDNPVSGVSIVFAANNSAVPALSTIVTDSNGKAVLSLQNTRKGDVTVSAYISASGASGKVSVTVTFLLMFDAPPKLTANSHDFTAGSGFPTTGFKGAKFVVGSPVAASNYSWSVDKEWASVSTDGTVTFTEQPVKNETLTITATPIQDGVRGIRYTVSVGSVYTGGGRNGPAVLWTAATCSPGTSHVAASLLTAGTDSRGIGTLWGEWGSFSQYSDSDIANGETFTNHFTNSGWQNTKLYATFVDLNTGSTSSEVGIKFYIDGEGTITKYNICKKD